MTVRPVSSTSGRRIGTATVYWRARRTLQSEFWYGPIRKAVSNLGDHYAENVTGGGDALHARAVRGEAPDFA